MYVTLAFFSYLLSLPPISPEGAALFTYENRSGKSDKEVFIQVVGVNPYTKNQCFIDYDPQGTPSYHDVLEKVDSSQFSFDLTHFEGSEKVIYLPQLNGARIYTSIDQKMSFLVIQNEKNQWTINAPNPLDPNDPNRHILWDKTEFAVNPFAIFINPTAVDNFSLPLYCEETGIDGSKQNGGLQESRQTVFQDLELAFQSAKTPWSSLLSEAPSLVYSPMFAAATGIFPEDFLVTSGWLDSFKEIFSIQPFLIDAEESFPIDLGGGIWQGLIDPNTLQIRLARVVDDTHPPIPPVYLSLPSKMSELIAGSGPSWKIETSLQAVFARNLSCAIDTNTLSTTEVLGQKYFLSHANEFYQRNTTLPEKLQFIDFYSKVLHSYGDHKIYTIPYDDELGQSGASSFVPKDFAKGFIILGPL